MLDQIFVGAALVGVSAIVQAVFMFGGFHALQAMRVHERQFARHHATAIIMLFVMFMFMAIIVEVWIWAAAYYWLGAIGTFSDALYVSTDSFTTIGQNTVPVASDWRLLVAFEGGAGMIIFGWATALLIAAIQHFDVWPSASRRRRSHNP